MRTGIDISYQIQDQESSGEVGTLPLPSNSNSRNNKTNMDAKGLFTRQKLETGKLNRPF